MRFRSLLLTIILLILFGGYVYAETKPRKFGVGLRYGIYDDNRQQFTDEYPLTPTQKSSLNDFMRTHNRTLPDYVPDAQVVFDPSSDKGIQLDQAPYHVNLYRKTAYMLDAKETVELEYGTAKKLKERVPNIYKLLHTIAVWDIPGNPLGKSQYAATHEEFHT